MKTATLLCAVLLLVVSGAGAGADPPKTDRDPWNGFPVGSWAIQTESFTRGDKTETRREKQTRVAAKDPGTIQLSTRAEGKTPGAFDGAESTSWHIPGYDPALDPKCTLLDTSKQDLMIQGKKYACEVKKYDLTRGENKATAVFWHCKGVDVPYRELGGEPRTLAVRPDVVRLDVDYRGKESSMRASIRVVNLREECKVGERTVVCVREEGEIEMSDGDGKGKGTVTVLLSNEVPGREVEFVAAGELGGAKLRKVRRVEGFAVAKGK